MKSQPRGRKGAPANTHRPRRLPHSPRPRLHFRAGVRTRPAPPSASLRSSYPQCVIYEKLSTPLLAALCKTFSPSRLRTRIYNIYRSPVGRSREEFAPLWPRVPRRCAQGGEGRRQRRPHPRAAPRPCPPTAEPPPPMGESRCAKAEVHKAIPAPARAFFPPLSAYRRAPAA